MNKLIHLAILSLILLLPATIAGHNIELDGIYYNIDSTQAIVTDGDYPYSGDVAIPPVISHNGMVYPVKTIGPAAFRNCSMLTSISIPASITAIGEHAFAGCTALDSVDISNLGKWCGIDFASETANPCYYAHRLFVEGKEIVELEVPDTVPTVSAFTFTGCSAITSANIPSSVTEIGPSLFSDCSSLAIITVDSGNPAYDSRNSCNAIIETATGRLIAGCKSTAIPSTVTAIGQWAFNRCSGLTSIHIPDSVTGIGLEAFYQCSSLMGVNIPNKVSHIGYQAFYGCSSLRSIHIPSSVRGIGTSAFEFCPSLMSISVAPGNPRFDSRDECNAIIETDGNTLIVGCRNTVIPSTVNEIGDYAFSGCSTLTSIEIPAGVNVVGDYAFRNCSAMRSVTFPEGISSIGASAFFECTSLNRVEIPSTVESIGSFAFEHCPAILIMTISKDNQIYDSRDSCNAIIETATNTLLAGCMNTVIPETVALIGDNAFSGCFMLTKVIIPKSVKTIGNYAFAECPSLSSINIPTTVTSIGEASFSGCSALTALDIPNSVASIGQAAFAGCTSLESISLPKSVTAIGDYEFYRCSMLKGINIPQDVTSIGALAFRGCLSLASINIPKAVTKIGGSAFRECPSLKSMTVSRDNPIYDSRQGCNALIETASGTLVAGCQNTVIPTSVTAIGYAAFDGCLFLSGITIPKTVTAIGHKAFNNCPALREVVCHISDPSLVTTADDAFLLPSEEYNDRKLHVPSAASATAFQGCKPWNEQFGIIVEMTHSNKN